MKFIPAALAVLLVCLAPPARAQDDDAKRTAAAEALLKAMHADQMIEPHKAAMKKSLDARIPKNLPPDTFKKIQDKMNADLDDVLKQYTWDSVKGDIVQLYSHTFTESELKELAAFYNSPIGQKYIGKRVDIDAGMQAIMEKEVQTLAPQIAQVIQTTAQAIKQAQPPALPIGPGFRNTAPPPEK